MSIEELESDLPASALVFLLRLRRVADRDVTDGVISDRNLRSVAAYHQMSRSSVTRNVEILAATGRLSRVSDSWVDTNFTKVCRTATEVESRKEQWRKAQRTHRAGKSSDESTDASSDDSPPSTSTSTSTSHGVRADGPSRRNQNTPNGTVHGNGRGTGRSDQQLHHIGKVLPSVTPAPNGTPEEIWEGNRPYIKEPGR